MLAGGLILLPIGLATTSPHPSQFSARSIFGFFYLVTFGSVIGYTAYVWLLDNAPLGTVATYAYVNPVVAIALGALVLHESLTWTIAIGATLVLACVAIVVRRESEPVEEPPPVPVIEAVRVRPAAASTAPSPADARAAHSSARSARRLRA
jgi:drug/metabolite transporter (DMT)-like permease